MEKLLEQELSKERMEIPEDLDSLIFLKWSMPELHSTSPERKSMEDQFTSTTQFQERKETKETEGDFSREETSVETTEEMEVTSENQIPDSRERLSIFNKIIFIIFFLNKISKKTIKVKILIF